ncbi:hypothetical protein EVAR_77762_1 [Eumeta japonica]|uniref:Uncharacterized protein n=1 Tax=Eumeta variegata TaxID=151549 RepID=A0A4C1TBX1_EUMVA|nr:hypothetical protein EVAR_77762_1 [Eumeta japonica]
MLTMRRLQVHVPVPGRRRRELILAGRRVRAAALAAGVRRARSLRTVRGRLPRVHPPWGHVPAERAGDHVRGARPPPTGAAAAASAATAAAAAPTAAPPLTHTMFTDKDSDIKQFTGVDNEYILYSKTSTEFIHRSPPKF